MTNLVEWVYVYFAALRIGVVTVPISTWLKAEELDYILTKAEVQHLILLDAFRKTNYYGMLEELCPQCAHALPGQLRSARFPDLRNVIVLPKRLTTQSALTSVPFSALLQPTASALSTADELATRVLPDDLALIKFTSGSTAFPKGVLLEQWGIATNAQLHARRLRLTTEDRWFSAMPFFHAGGSIWGLMTMVAIGGTLIFTEAFDARTAVRLIEKERCSVQFGVGPMIRDEVNLLRAQGRKLEGLRLCVRGDAALVDEIHDWLGAEVVFSAYGATEAYGPDAVLGPLDPREKSQTQGRFLDGIEYRVVDPSTSEDVSNGETGECLVRGLVMRGYYNEPNQTSRAVDSDGWLHTRDLVRLDQDAYVTYIGRLTAMIKVGGENVAPEEVENCIRRLPGVLECCVVGVKDARRGEVPRAYLLASKQGADPLNLVDVRAWCLQHLARYKVPADFIIVDALPMTGPGKVDRAALIRDKFANEPPS